MDRLKGVVDTGLLNVGLLNLSKRPKVVFFVQILLKIYGFLKGVL